MENSNLLDNRFQFLNMLSLLLNNLGEFFLNYNILTFYSVSLLTSDSVLRAVVEGIETRFELDIILVLEIDYSFAFLFLFFLTNAELLANLSLLFLKLEIELCNTLQGSASMLRPL